MAPGDVAQFGRIDQRGHGRVQLGEHRAVARVKQQRLLVADEEVVELQVEVGVVDRQAEDVGGGRFLGCGAFRVGASPES
jgi:hypothetical protein